MRLFLTRRFQKNFEKLTKKTQQEAKEALKKIYIQPYSGKKLTGPLTGDYSFRIGQYRILYTVEKDNIWIETVRHRKEVYRKR